MIICVSANPAIDRRVRLKKLTPGAVHRAVSAKSFAGGKAAHVAMAAHALGEETVWTGFLGGATGDELERQLNELGIRAVPVRTLSKTRTNDEIIDEQGNITEILEPGGTITDDELEQMYENCERLIVDAVEDFYVVLSGSLPPNLPLDFYSRLISSTHEHGGKVILDTSGEAFLNALSANPDLVKPNREEAEHAIGVNIDSPYASILAASRLREMGAQNVAVSLGRDGIVWLDGDKLLIARPPRVDVISTVGSGDATVAGFAVGGIRSLGNAETIRLAIACGTANCLAKLPGQIDAETVKRLLPLVEVKSIRIDAANHVSDDAATN
jgi:1-phosphofructokinase family hexose kinase